MKLKELFAKVEEALSTIPTDELIKLIIQFIAWRQLVANNGVLDVMTVPGHPDVMLMHLIRAFRSRPDGGEVLMSAIRGEMGVVDPNSPDYQLLEETLINVGFAQMCQGGSDKESAPPMAPESEPDKS